MARLEERMNTMQAEYESALDRNNAAFERMRADMATHREDAAKRETDAVKREKQQLLAIAGLISLATIIIGLLVRWPV